MTQYNIGDIVTIRKPASLDPYFSWLKDMNKFDGVVTKVKDKSLDRLERYIYQVEGTHWWFLEEWLENPNAVSCDNLEGEWNIL